MKFIKMLIVILLFTYFLPLGGFCHQPKDVKGQAHCAVCHTVSPQIVVSNINTFVDVLPSLQAVIPQITLSYQNPSLETLKRPPAVST
jgi:hypothetical protein